MGGWDMCVLATKERNCRAGMATVKSSKLLTATAARSSKVVTGYQLLLLANSNPTRVCSLGQTEWEQDSSL